MSLRVHPEWASIQYLLQWSGDVKIVFGEFRTLSRVVHHLAMHLLHLSFDGVRYVRAGVSCTSLKQAVRLLFLYAHAFPYTACIRRRISAGVTTLRAQTSNHSTLIVLHHSFQTSTRHFFNSRNNACKVTDFLSHNSDGIILLHDTKPTTGKLWVDFFWNIITF